MAANLTNFPSNLWLRAIDELISRLPLSLITANMRMSAISDYTVTSDSCLKCCNVLFEVLLAHVRTLSAISNVTANPTGAASVSSSVTESPPPGNAENSELVALSFPSLWLRFISILATNAGIVSPGVHFHEEMLEMIAALLRVLRYPIHNLLNSSGGGSGSGSNQQSSSSSSSSSTSAFGFLFLWSTQETTPAPAPAPAPAPEIEGAKDKTGGADNGSESAEDDDSLLLYLSWKSLSSAYRQLPSLLKVKNPQLVGDILRFVEYYEPILQQQRQQQQGSGSNGERESLIRSLDSRTHLV